MQIVPRKQDLTFHGDNLHEMLNPVFWIHWRQFA